MKIQFLLIIMISVSICDSDRGDPNKIINMVKRWSKNIGEELLKLSLTMTRKDRVTESFKPLKNRIYKVEGATLVRTIGRQILNLMYNKVQAVKNIAKYAQFLSYHRRTDKPFKKGDNFGFYNAANITVIKENPNKQESLRVQITEAECKWFCQQMPLNSPILSNNSINELFKSRDSKDFDNSCNCNSRLPTYYPPETYNWLPLTKDHRYDMPINTNLSVVKINANIYEKDPEVLEGIRWSEPLDLIFKKNLANDSTLKFQYFASPLGYMRHFPAVQWSSEPYDVTYDPRTRSWYTEAMTSPKDMIILLDRSGSMCGENRKVAEHIVNNILDTLNDNDFVNIYTFTNSTEPLVSCFADTLVQANEENLRLLRESLSIYNVDFVADIALGFKKAFQLLEDFRNKRKGAQCNQAIMLITEGVDYDYKPYIFNDLNWKKESPVRVFTYQVKENENDAVQMEWIACANRGWFVNISLFEETREKVLPYMNVMSRPINLEQKSVDKTEPIWSYLYIDLADRRYSNWLWRKYEGIRQREIFLDHTKRAFIRLQQFLTSEDHILYQDTHEYDKYHAAKEFDYMTTVSMPVYGLREDDLELVGVAGVDVPIKLFYSLIPHYKLGVNGYAFLLTNNGYVLMHPMHRREFENIPKPTFNRVDFVEVEILDDLSEPRLFDKKIVELREAIIGRGKGDKRLNIKFAVDDMKRIILSKRHYYYENLGPFRIGIALPDNYGLMVVRHSANPQDSYKLKNGLLLTKNWTVHPDWVYFDDNSPRTPKEVIKSCLLEYCDYNNSLVSSLLFDGDATKWFEDRIVGEEILIKKHIVDNVFLATHSGLTRWRKFSSQDDVTNDDTSFVKTPPYHGTRATDEDWYKRVVEENLYKEDNTFIYSVPFEISGFEDNTMVTSTHAIFVENKDKSIPIAAVGMQFNHRALVNMYNKITERCGKEIKNCSPDECNFLECNILDNNAYVIVSDEIEYTGRFIGDIRPDIMNLLVKNNVYKSTRMFDYQAICQKLTPKSRTKCAASSPSSILRNLFTNIAHIINWTFSKILMLVRTVTGGPKYQSIKNETLVIEKLEIKKTFPTPCDQEMYLFTLRPDFNTTTFNNTVTSKFVCDWVYIIEKIPHSNLVLLVINEKCKIDTTNIDHKSPTPIEIVYNDISLPCYIANFNNFTRKSYMQCFNHSKQEDGLNAENATYCGHTWK